MGARGPTCAPGLAATALSEEKARRTLEDLFTTALTSWDILLGKFLARALLDPTLKAMNYVPTKLDASH